MRPIGENGVVQTSGQTPKREVTGIEAKLLGPSPDQASADNPVTLVFMGYKTVEEEQETRTALGMEGVDGNVKAEFVVIEDGEGKAGGEAATADQAPPNGSMAEKEKANGGGEEGEKEKEKKQTCKCCTVMWAVCVCACTCVGVCDAPVQACVALRVSVFGDVWSFVCACACARAGVRVCVSGLEKNNKKMKYSYAANIQREPIQAPATTTRTTKTHKYTLLCILSLICIWLLISIDIFLFFCLDIYIVFGMYIFIMGLCTVSSLLLLLEKRKMYSLSGLYCDPLGEIWKLSII